MWWPTHLKAFCSPRPIGSINTLHLALSIRPSVALAAKSWCIKLAARVYSRIIHHITLHHTISSFPPGPKSPHHFTYFTCFTLLTLRKLKPPRLDIYCSIFLSFHPVWRKGKRDVLPFAFFFFFSFFFPCVPCLASAHSTWGLDGWMLYTLPG